MSTANAPSPAAGGQAAPASPGKQQSGAAAPASNGTPAGNPSATPSAEAALVEAKKQAEHWRKKYERDVGATNERLAKLEGLAQGFQANQPAAPKPPAKTLADLDSSSLREVVKKGFEDNNPEYVTAAVEELVDRIASQKSKDVEQRALDRMNLELRRRQVFSEIARDYPAASDEDSPLRQESDRLIGGYDADVLKQHPELYAAIFAQANHRVSASDREDLGRLRKSEADRIAREELERSHQVIATQAKNDVADALGRKDIKGAIRTRLPFITERGR